MTAILEILVYTLLSCLVALERALEDHEVVVEALSHWPKGHHNTIHFRNNPDKYLLFTKPQVQCVE